MKTYFDGLDHNTEIFPLWSKALREWKASLNEPDWDKVDVETKAMEEEEALQELNEEHE